MASGRVDASYEKIPPIAGADNIGQVRGIFPRPRRRHPCQFLEVTFKEQR
jgi:hypothetical protein